MMDAGLISFALPVNTAPPGRKPTFSVTYGDPVYFEERHIGFERAYAAKGVNETVDAVVRIWRPAPDEARIGGLAKIMCAEGRLNGEYTIQLISPGADAKSGLKVLDITLMRREGLL